MVHKLILDTLANMTAPLIIGSRRWMRQKLPNGTCGFCDSFILYVDSNVFHLRHTNGHALTLLICQSWLMLLWALYEWDREWVWCFLTFSSLAPPPPWHAEVRGLYCVLTRTNCSQSSQAQIEYVKIVILCALVLLPWIFIFTGFYIMPF